MAACVDDKLSQAISVRYAATVSWGFTCGGRWMRKGVDPARQGGRRLGRRTALPAKNDRDIEPEPQSMVLFPAKEMNWLAGGLSARRFNAPPRILSRRLVGCLKR